MDKLVCSLCGFTSEQKKFRCADINKHFDNAKEIWCPTNKCRENNKDRRIVPTGHICNCWYDYCGWHTIEEKPKIINIDTVKSIQKAKMLKEIGIKILQK